jgi:nogalaviketone/aklaviketone reductase
VTESAVVITGGGTGIGRATAQAFAGAGADVLIVGRTKATLDETAAGRPRIHALVADISEPDAPETIVRTALDRFGRIDVLVNNAAFIREATLDRLDRAETEAQLTINLLAPVYLTQQALGPLTDSRGTVINVSTAQSVGQRAWPGTGIYGAGKAGLDYLTRTWAVELAPRGIRVVGIAPGPIDTGLYVRMNQTEEQHTRFRAWALSQTPLARIGQPDEVAHWIVRLAEPAAAHLTGIVLPVDGGFSIA